MGRSAWACAPESPSRSEPSTPTGTPSAQAAAKATSSTSSAPPPASSPCRRRPTSSPASAESFPAAFIPATPASKPASPPPAISSKPSPAAPDTKSPNYRKGLETYRAGQTGLLRLSWDNGDRTVLVNSELGGVTLGWNLIHTAQDELYAAIEGTAFHTRIILERMAEYGVPVDRVINAGGIPQNNQVLNQVYADVLGKPVLVPAGIPTSLGSGIFAFLAAGTFPTIEEAQSKMCLSYKTFTPNPAANATYNRLFEHYKRLYFALGKRGAEAAAIGDVLPDLRKIAAEVQRRPLKACQEGNHQQSL